MPTLGGARATQKIMQESAGGITDAQAQVLSGADLSLRVAKTETGLADALLAKLSGADQLHYDANN